MEKEGFTHLMSSCTKSRKKLPLNCCNHLDLDPKAVVQLVRISGKMQHTFPSKENGRVLAFKTETQAQAHLDTGKHARKLECKSVFDEVRKKRAKRVTGERLLAPLLFVLGLENDQPSTSSSSSPITNANRKPQGWTLKVATNSGFLLNAEPI